MQRRHLRVISSSSDDDDDEVSAAPRFPEAEVRDIEEDEQTVSNLNLQRVTLNSFSSISNPTPRNPNVVQPIPFNISDDEDDAGNGDGGAGIDHFSGRINHSHDSGNSTNNHPCSDGPISSILLGMGLRLRREWMESCIQGLERLLQGFSGFDDSAKAKLCFEQFLLADMNFCGAGVLPENVHSLHLVDLKGPFVLQVDEIVNISCPLKGRYQKAAAGIKRCLKLSMTDGVQRVFGMEYRPIKDLEVLSPAGLKVVINNVNVRRGLLMLVPEVIEVLGGKVQALVEAQERLIHEVNKPPRGKRTKTGLVTPLARRATLAAWQPGSTNEQDNGNSGTGMAPTQMDQQGTSFDNPASHENIESYSHFVRSEDAEAVPADINQVHTVTRVEQQASGMNREESAGTTGRQQAKPNSCNDEIMNNEHIHIVDDLESHFLVPVEKEHPFTYLAALSARRAATRAGASKVQGKIKCFLTGVKGFQYKHRTMYELRVYVDDGSLISEILIDHNVVQKGIGYSPVEVSTALASSDYRQVSNMKETLKQFQIFLVNFEGTMLLELSDTSSIPVAIEMNQGCPASDAWLLLERVRSSGSARQREDPHLNAITLSP